MVVIVAYVMLGLELSVKRALAIGPPGAASIAPSFIVPFLVFLALSAPLVPTLWVALVLGLAVDICSPRGASADLVVGPYALAFMAGAYFVFTMRGLMRRHWLSVIFLSIVASILIELVVVAFFSVRGLYSASDFVAWRELLRRAAGSVYTGVTAAILAAMLLPASGVFGFNEQQHRRFASRRS